MAMFVAYSNSVVTSGKKISSRPQMGGHFEDVKILNTASIWQQKWKSHPKLCKKKYVHGDDVIDDVTEWPPIPLWMKNNIFRDNWRTIKDIVFTICLHMCVFDADVVTNDVTADAKSAIYIGV